VIVRSVDIDEVVDHHCLPGKLFFIIAAQQHITKDSPE
jgi:hypothetical protein